MAQEAENKMKAIVHVTLPKGWRRLRKGVQSKKGDRFLEFISSAKGWKWELNSRVVENNGNWSYGVLIRKMNSKELAIEANRLAREHAITANREGWYSEPIPVPPLLSFKHDR